MLSLATARAEALFASDLPVALFGDRTAVDAAIRTSVRTHSTVRGCAADMAYEFGRHPVEAAVRMCRCRTAVQDAYSRRPECLFGSQSLAVAA